MKDVKIYYPWNKTFKYYSEPKSGKRAFEFIEEQNKCKGGKWVLHNKEEYQDWYDKKGKFLEETKHEN